MKRWFTDLGSIALALALGIAVWVIAVQEEYPSAEFPEPIAVSRTGLPENMSIFGDILDEVRIEVRAPKRRWETLKASDFTAWVDLSNVHAAEYDIAVMVKAPDPQVQVLSIDPPVIRVRIEERVTRTLPVRVNIMDAPAFGYDWQTPVISPTQVSVLGSQSLVEQVDTAIVEMYLRGARATVERSLRVTVRNSAGEALGFVTANPREVNVTVPVVQLPGYREVPVLVESVGQPAPGYTVNSVAADPKLVTLFGDPEIIDSHTGYITVAVDINDAMDDVVERVPLRLPENISALGNQSVSVRVGIAPIAGVQTIRRKPVIQGLGAGLTYTLTLDSVSVFLSGPVPKLEVLRVDSAPVIVDLTGLEPGVHVVEPIVPAPEGISVVGLSPQTLEITIARLPTPTPTPTSVATLTPPTSAATASAKGTETAVAPPDSATPAATTTAATRGSP